MADPVSSRDDAQPLGMHLAWVVAVGRDLVGVACHGRHPVAEVEGEEDEHQTHQAVAVVDLTCRVEVVAEGGFDHAVREPEVVAAASVAPAVACVPSVAELGAEDSSAAAAYRGVYELTAVETLDLDAQAESLHP